MDEVRLMPPLTQGLGGAEAVGDVPAERCFLPQPGDLHQARLPSSGGLAS